MVHSRSEGRLNQIFLDLCTSPKVHHRHHGQRNYPRQYHPPLPKLKPIKSNSCSNVKDLVKEHDESLPSDNDNDKSDDNLFQTNSPAGALAKRKSSLLVLTSPCLTSMQSTGFTVGTALTSTNDSSISYKTSTESFIRTHARTKKHSKGENHVDSSLSSNSLPLPRDRKRDTFRHRLHNRLKSRNFFGKHFRT